MNFAESPTSVRSSRQAFSIGSKAGEKFHAVHRRRRQADCHGQRVVEMQRIVVARNRRIALQRRRVEGTDDRLRKLVAHFDVAAHAAAPNARARNEAQHGLAARDGARRQWTRCSRRGSVAAAFPHGAA